MTIDYRIVVRTYKRPELFYKYTYSLLEKQGIDLAKRLIIVLANEEELQSYSESLKKMKYLTTIFSGVGAKEAVIAGCKFVGDGVPVVYMDDDMEAFFEFITTPSNDKNTLVEESTNLERYILDGFETCRKENLNAFSFLYMKNPFYIKDKPFKETKPFKISGGFFGILSNNEYDVCPKYGHTEETQRSVKIIERYGSALLYNWCGFKTQTGFLEGGMQISNDRGTPDEKSERTKEISWQVYTEDSLIRKYCKEPKFMDHTEMWELVLKPVNSLKKFHAWNHVKWKNYFDTIAVGDDIPDPFFGDLSN